MTPFNHLDQYVIVSRLAKCLEHLSARGWDPTYIIGAIVFIRKKLVFTVGFVFSDFGLMLCYVMLCYVMLCYVTLFPDILRERSRHPTFNL